LARGPGARGGRHYSERLVTALGTSSFSTMKSFLILISLVSLVSTTPLVYNEQFSLGTQQGSYPGFDLDLNAVRLVQMEGESPVWMTELDKVINQRNS
jgi:hypothetical protein